MTSKTICSEGLARTRRLVWEIEGRRPGPPPSPGLELARDAGLAADVVAAEARETERQ